MIVITGVNRYGTVDGRQCAEMESEELGLPEDIVDFKRDAEQIDRLFVANCALYCI